MTIFVLLLWVAAVVATAVAARKIDKKTGRPYLPVTFSWIFALGTVLFLIGGPVPGWVWLAWVVALVAATFARFKVAAATFAAVTGLAALVVALALFAPARVQTNAAAPQTQSVVPDGTGTAPASCPPQFAQKWDPNQANRFASAGLWDNAATKAVSVDGAVTRQKALAGHDARYLAGAAWSVQLWDDPNKVAPLLTADKSCLSTEGTSLYNKLVQKWDKAASVSIGQAPADGVNTGSQGGMFVANGSPGIQGDRTALIRVYADGTRSIDLVRCGNFVLPAAPPKVPVGRTDQSPPPTVPPSSPPVTTPPPTTPPPSSPPATPTPTPTPVCEYNSALPPNSPECLKPKNPADSLPGPSGKPLAPPPSRKAESTPPVEPHPANPSVTPGAPAPSTVTAPKATPMPARTAVPSPVPSVAPPPSSPGTHISDPDGGAPAPVPTGTMSTQSTAPHATQQPAGAPPGGPESSPPAAGMFALPLGGLGVLVRRKLYG